MVYRLIENLMSVYATSWSIFEVDCFCYHSYILKGPYSHVLVHLAMSLMMKEKIKLFGEMGKIEVINLMNLCEK